MPSSSAGLNQTRQSILDAVQSSSFDHSRTWTDTVSPTEGERALAETLSASTSNDIAYALALIRMEQVVTPESVSTLARVVRSAANINPLTLHVSAHSQARPAWLSEYTRSRPSRTTQASLGPTDPQSTQNTAAQADEPTQSGVAAIQQDQPPIEPADVSMVVDIETETQEDDDTIPSGARSPVQGVKRRQVSYSAPRTEQQAAKKRKHQKAAVNGHEGDNSTQPSWTLETSEKIYDYIIRLTRKHPLDPGVTARRAVNIVLGHHAGASLEELSEHTLVDNVDLNKGRVFKVFQHVWDSAKKSTEEIQERSFRAAIDWCVCIVLKRRMLAHGYDTSDLEDAVKTSTKVTNIDRGALRWLKAAMAMGDLAFTPLLLNIEHPFSSLWRLAEMEEDLWGAFLTFLQTGEDGRDQEESERLWRSRPSVAVRRDAARFTVKYMLPMTMASIMEALQTEAIETFVAEVDNIGADVTITSSEGQSTTSGISSSHRNLRVLVNGSSGVQITTPTTSLILRRWRPLMRADAIPPPREQVKWLKKISTFGLIEADFDEAECRSLFASYRAVHNIVDDNIAKKFYEAMVLSFKHPDRSPRWDIELDDSEPCEKLPFLTPGHDLLEQARDMAFRYFGLYRTGQVAAPADIEQDTCNADDEERADEPDDSQSEGIPPTSNSFSTNPQCNSADQIYKDKRDVGEGSRVGLSSVSDLFLSSQSQGTGQTTSEISDRPATTTKSATGPNPEPGIQATPEFHIIQTSVLDFSQSDFAICSDETFTDGSGQDYQDGPLMKITSALSIDTTLKLSRKQNLKIKKELSTNLEKDRSKQYGLRCQVIHIDLTEDTDEDEDEDEDETRADPAHPPFREGIILLLWESNYDAFPRAETMSWVNAPYSERSAVIEREAIGRAFASRAYNRIDRVESQLARYPDALKWYREHRNFDSLAHVKAMAMVDIQNTLPKAPTLDEHKFWLSEFYRLRGDEIAAAVDRYVRSKPTDIFDKAGERDMFIAIFRLWHLEEDTWTYPSAQRLIARSVWSRDDHIRDHPERSEVGGALPKVAIGTHSDRGAAS